MTGKYQFITGFYDSDGSIRIFLRDEQYNKYSFPISGFEPHFFVDSNITIPQHQNLVRIENGFKNYNKLPVTKIVMRTPTDVGGDNKSIVGFRESFQKPYESDIRYVNRMLINTGITSGVELPAGDHKSIDYRQLKPVEFSLPPYYAIIDIEVFSKTRFPDMEQTPQPIVCITMWDSFHLTYVTILLDDTELTEKPQPDWRIVHVTSETKLIEYVNNYFDYLFDIVTGWNFDFDNTYFFRRARKLGIYLTDLKHRGTCEFDMLKANKMVAKPMGNELSNVLNTETVKLDSHEITIADKIGYMPWKSEYWEDKELRQKLAAKVNRTHVEGLVELDKKYGLINFFWELKNLAGLEDMQETFYHGTLADILNLRWYNKYGLVVPSRPPKGSKGEKISGAMVLPPEVGIYYDIAIFDMSRYYPTIIIGYNITFEDVKQGEKGIFPQICEFLLKTRETYEECLSKMEAGTIEYEALDSKKDAVKYLCETEYGTLGSPTSRYYRRESAAMITEKARNGLVAIKEFTESLNYKVIFGDTDSIAIQIPQDKVQWMEEKLNEFLVEYSKKEGMTRVLKLKTEKYADKAIFTEAKIAKRGAMKRYGLHVTMQKNKPCNYVKIVGYDAIKKDSSKISKMILRYILETALKSKGDVKQNIIAYTRDVINKFRKGQYTLDEIGIPRTFGKKLNEYKVDNPWLRGTRWSNTYLNADIRGGDMVKIIYGYVEGYPHTDCVAFLYADQLPKGLKIAYGKMVDVCIKKKIETTLKVLNITWDQCMNQQTLMEAMMA